VKKKEKEEETSPVRARVGTLTGHIAPQTDERPLRGSSNEDPGGDAAVLALDRASVRASQLCAQHSIGVYPILLNAFRGLFTLQRQALSLLGNTFHAFDRFSMDFPLQRPTMRDTEFSHSTIYSIPEGFTQFSVMLFGDRAAFSGQAYICTQSTKIRGGGGVWRRNSLSHSVKKAD
jgi:hypothetical protein